MAAPHHISRMARVTALAALSIVGAVVATPASAQGLFDVLFGRREVYAPQPSFRPAPDPRYQPRYRQTSRAAPIPERRRVVNDEPAGPRTYTPPEVLPGPLGRFLADPTLRRGDVVATANGLMIFRGSGGSRHSPSDFVALSAGSKYVSAKSADLAALDRVLKMNHGRTSAVSRLASAESPIVAEDDTSPKKSRRR